MMAQTLQLAFRIAFVWAGGFLLAVAVRALLPDQSGLTFAGNSSPTLPPISPRRPNNRSSLSRGEASKLSQPSGAQSPHP